MGFRKAFDTLEWSCIHYALELYNFGDSLRNWVKVFYTEIESAVISNGFATNWFKPTSGVRQGALTICTENPVIPGRIQMERFIPVECLRKKGNTFRGIPFSRFFRNSRKFLYHLSTITSARLFPRGQQCP